MCIITSKEHLIKEIAEALENSSSDVSWRIDLTAQEVIPILDPTLVDEDCMPENGHRMIASKTCLILPWSSVNHFQPLRMPYIGLAFRRNGSNTGMLL